MRGRRDLEESPVAGLSMVTASCCSAVKDTPDFEQLLFWSENKWHFCKTLSLLLPCLHFFFACFTPPKVQLPHTWLACVHALKRLRGGSVLQRFTLRLFLGCVTYTE